MDRATYTCEESRSTPTAADAFMNYATLARFYNQQKQLRRMGDEKEEWYGTRVSRAARLAVRLRIDNMFARGRVLTAAEFKNSGRCKPEWKPSIYLLPRSSVAKRGRGLMQPGLDAFVHSG
eukprot:7142604-Prymnesium_polylepis.2